MQYGISFYSSGFATSARSRFLASGDGFTVSAKRCSHAHRFGTNIPLTFLLPISGNEV